MFSELKMNVNVVRVLNNQFLFYIINFFITLLLIYNPTRLVEVYEFVSTICLCNLPIYLSLWNIYNLCHNEFPNKYDS